MRALSPPPKRERRGVSSSVLPALAVPGLCVCAPLLSTGVLVFFLLILASRDVGGVGFTYRVDDCCIVQTRQGYRSNGNNFVTVGCCRRRRRRRRRLGRNETRVRRRFLFIAVASL